MPAIATSPATEWVSVGHQVPIPSVNSLNAAFWTSGTVTVLRITRSMDSGASEAVNRVAMSVLHCFLCGRPESLQGTTPELVHEARMAPIPSGLTAYTRRVPSARTVTSPASVSTRRCWETAGRVTGMPSAIWCTASGPGSSRS